MKQLHVIFKTGETEPLWAEVTTPEVAQIVGVRYAVNTGSAIDVVSGDNLRDRLLQASPVVIPVDETLADTLIERLDAIADPDESLESTRLEVGVGVYLALGEER